MKKILSILMALCMIFSLCTMAISSVSAEEVTINDLGVTANCNGVLADDPAGSGEKVIKMSVNNNRPNLELNAFAADANGDKEAKFAPAVGTTYTLLFDYYFASPSTATGFDFAMYYGAQSAYHANYSKVAISSTKSGVSQDYLGDNKWHSAAITFTGSEQKGKVNGEANQTLPYMYFTCYSSGKFNVYFKNIRVVTETKANDIKIGEYNFDYLFNDDGTANTKYFTNNKFEASDMTDSFVNADGENVFVVTEKGADLTVSKGSQHYHTGDNLIVATPKSDGSLNKLSNRVSYYTFVIKYKVLKLGANGKASIGFGRDSTTATNCLYQYSMEQTNTDTEWQYFYGTYKMGAIASGAPITIALGGPGAHIAIDSIQVVSVVDLLDNAGIYVLNDSGEITINYGYVGTSITEEGNNAYNVDTLGEEFLGWTDTSDFNTIITEYPASAGVENSAILCAKYPTVVLDDFAAISAYTDGNQKQKGAVTVNADGTITVNSNSNGAFMIPAYDAPIAVGYEFLTNTQYLVNIYYNSIALTNDATSADIQWIRGERYGSGYKREGTGIFSKKVSATEEPGVLTKTISYKTYLQNAAGEDIKTLLYRGNGGPSANSIVVIDKITITDMSLVPLADKEMANEGSFREESGTGAEYVSAGIRFKGTVSEAFRASATEIGFYAAPTAALNGASMAEYILADGNVAISAQVKADGMEEILYDEATDAYGRKTYDYQLIITGLTREGVAENLLGTDITCVLYAVVDGQTVYTNEIAYCYNDVANK